MGIVTAAPERPRVHARRSGVRPIRPCMVSFYFHPDYSGSAVQAHNLSRYLQRRGMEPTIVSANLSASAAFERIDGIPVHRIAVAKPRELQIPSFWISLLNFLVRRRGEFDLIHAHGTLQHGTAALAGRLLRKPSILKVAMAGSDIAFEKQGRIRGPLNRYFVEKFDRYIATTDEIVSEFRERRFDVRRVRAIPNGVDTDCFAPLTAGERNRLKRELGLPDVPLITYVGIINERKNVDGALRIWKEAVSRRVPGHLLLIGPYPDGSEPDPFYASLQQYIRQHGLGSRVSFLGLKKPVVPYLQVSDAFIFPSKREGMANSVLEAMACGLPCLVSREAGVSSVIQHGHNGFALDVDDEFGFAGTVCELLTRDAFRARLGAAARATIVEKYSLDRVADQFVELYEELLGR